ncbi:hypothetical protein PR202_ga06296 [Eleusine coracana subsp. coracana]|uniref:Uncharacterized protein n=1 Tax=Eleusine coracana subsp. coracana TaxID=191504 RepID=A0AAV5BY31_ELECO|nr:hypothetical protein PR202_ga06296 [Eleusine coracana subsp. coracana]
MCSTATKPYLPLRWSSPDQTRPNRSPLLSKLRQRFLPSAIYLSRLQLLACNRRVQADGHPEAKRPGQQLPPTSSSMEEEDAEFGKEMRLRGERRRRASMEYRRIRLFPGFPGPPGRTRDAGASSRRVTSAPSEEAGGAPSRAAKEAALRQVMATSRNLPEEPTPTGDEGFWYTPISSLALEEFGHAKEVRVNTISDDVPVPDADHVEGVAEDVLALHELMVFHLGSRSFQQPRRY